VASVVEGPVVPDRAAFEAEARRLLGAAEGHGVTLRLLGALAFRIRCPGHVGLQERMGRTYTDLDFAAYGKDAERIRRWLAGEGYVEDPGVYVESQGSRLVFEHPGTGLHLDVFLDKLEFSHTIEWKGRLEVDRETIPLAEMLLQKMQILEINEKDLIDTILLFLEHPVGETDDGTVNAGHVARLCSAGWGLWRTTTMNLEKVRQLAEASPHLGDGERERVREQVERVLIRIEAEPKSLGWRLRARIGDRKKWYRDVGELR
jgi:hypothetical protein